MKLLIFVTSLAVAFTLLRSPLNAFSLGQQGQEKESLDIKAVKGMECLQGEKTCIAYGPVTIVKGASTLTCSKAILHFKKGRASSEDIEKLEFFDPVVFSIASQKVKATGKYALYDPKEGTLILQGNPYLQDEKVFVYGDQEIIFYDQKALAISAGRTTVKTNDKLLQANLIHVHFKRDPSNKLLLSSLEAEGDVIISTPIEIGRGDRGRYQADTEVAELFENVKLTSEKFQLRGDHARFDMKAGRSHLVNRGKSFYETPRIQACLMPLSPQVTRSKKDKDN